MSAFFSRFFVVAAFLLVVLFLADTTFALPLFQDRSEYTGATGPADGGNVNPSSSGSCDGGQCHHGPVLDLLSNNAGHGGNSKSGDATTFFQGISKCRSDDNNAYSGASGSAQGGSTTDDDALANILSGNAGNGGASESGSAGDSHCQ
ncbi:hypothetical protein D9757_006195 [Collybiopsis confluens]|uniref:Secreted protein n=1 Tax=Collybiopsis confluens TaxID=2823264 RepID=A0A8H5HJW6_9AGAR|nr:hypothetical protein D9757_006195 [Collybiopsis confluens]